MEWFESKVLRELVSEVIQVLEDDGTKKMAAFKLNTTSMQIDGEMGHGAYLDDLAGKVDGELENALMVSGAIFRAIGLTMHKCKDNRRIVSWTDHEIVLLKDRVAGGDKLKNVFEAVLQYRAAPDTKRDEALVWVFDRISQLDEFFEMHRRRELCRLLGLEWNDYYQRLSAVRAANRHNEK